MTDHVSLDDVTNSSQRVREGLLTGARYMVYMLLVLAYMGAVPAVIRRQGLSSFYENSLIECGQLAVLGVTCLGFAVEAWRRKAVRELLALLAFTTAFAIARELDYVFDSAVPVIGWKVALVLPVAGCWIAVRNWPAAFRQIIAFLRSTPFVLLWAGFVVAAPFAQLFGHSPLLRLLTITDVTQVRNVKRVMEESAEFVGYLLLFFGMIETLILIRRRYRLGSGA